MVRGKLEEFFLFLHSFLYMIEKTNKESVVDLKTNNDNTYYMCTYHYKPAFMGGSTAYQ